MLRPYTHPHVHCRPDLNPCVWPRAHSGAIVRAFKSATTKRINERQGTPGKQVWQRNYFDRVIRSDDELYRARRYILTNPDRWSNSADS